jgi:hypothetical protein
MVATVWFRILMSHTQKSKDIQQFWHVIENNGRTLKDPTILSYNLCDNMKDQEVGGADTMREVQNTHKM